MDAFRELDAVKVSVCLASYNGSSFIRRQLESILSDLQPQDELILSDDASIDDTIAIVESFADSRVSIMQNSENVRHVRNFERALTAATGDIIFLSDQDDIWLPGKRSEVVRIFQMEPGVSMVVHALSLIDSQGRIIAERSGVWPKSSKGKQRSFPFIVRQLGKNQVTGCAVAFRRTLLRLILPFPSSVYAHDHWLSVAAPFAGDVYFLDRVLLQYRQHDGNLTPKGGLDFTKKLRVRALLARLVIVAAMRAIGKSHGRS